ncbi:FliM/FliN family flagellar motor switch protein [Jiella sp. M17.18]|uniref:FliM/FliN family flagellar motor switch protein n=1 Tax=Jiella sp. M17.18 TaxID=3234247 RepID=UPI0034DF8F98
MSDTALASDPVDIGARLKSAAEIEPKRLPRLTRMGEEWAEALATGVTRLAVAAPEVEFLECDVEDAPDLGDAAIKASLLAVIDSRRFDQPGYVLLQRTAIEALVAAFFGAEPSADLAASREPTALDKRLLTLLLQTLAQTAGPVFAPLVELDVTVGGFVAPDGLAEELGENPGRFLQFRFTLSVSGLETPIIVALPVSFFAPHRRLLSDIPQVQKVDPDETWSKGIEASFARSDLRIEAVLCKKKILLSEVAGFRVGATVPLDVALTSLIPLECEDRPLFRAQVGRSRDSYVVRIEERVDPAQEFFDGILSD